MWERLKQIIALPKVVEDNHATLSKQIAASVGAGAADFDKQLNEIRKEYEEIKESLWIQSKQIWALIDTHHNKDMYFGVFNKPETKKK